LPCQVVKYAAVNPDDRLRQGEVLVGFVRVRQSLGSIGSQDIGVDEVTHPYLIIMTQDCDLAQDADARLVLTKAASDPSLLSDIDFKKQFDNAPRLKIENVLLCEAMSTSDMKSSIPPGKDIWKRIIQNKDERYQCLEAVPPDLDLAAMGMPSLSCDFKRFLTMPVDEVYKRLALIESHVRRARLLTPYAEHLLHRFCCFQSRIPLPENHEVQI
jgi:hypothetical protein